jgi:hypothetical protein
MEGAAKTAGSSASVGACFELSRPVSRQPLFIKFAKFSANCTEVSQEVVALEILRIHQVLATQRDMESGHWVELVRMRAADFAATIRGDQR